MSAQVGIPNRRPRPCLVFSLSYYPYFTIYTSISVYNLICTDPASLSWRTAQSIDNLDMLVLCKANLQDNMVCTKPTQLSRYIGQSNSTSSSSIGNANTISITMESEQCYVITPGIATTSGITISITLHILKKKSYPGTLEKATPLVVVVLPLLVM